MSFNYKSGYKEGMSSGVIKYDLSANISAN